MIILGLLLVLGVAGLALAVIVANDSVFGAPAGTVELFGYSTGTTVGQVLLAGAVAGALALLGIFMLISGLGRRARRRSAARRAAGTQRQEMRDLQRKHDAVSQDLAHQRADDDNAADRDEANPRRR